MNVRVIAAALAVPCLALLAPLQPSGQPSPAFTASQPEASITAPVRCYYIDVQACTSCAEQPTSDKECIELAGSDWTHCSKPIKTCSNGTICDQHSGYGVCPQPH